MHRERAWAPKGEKVMGEISGKKLERTNIIAGKCGKEVYAPCNYKCTTDTALFNTWLEKCLLPELPPGKVIVLDNAAFHKNKKTKEIIERAGCKLLYLPPYSPDLNPIEKFWAWLKGRVRSIMKDFTSLNEALNYLAAEWK
jgi:transposase